MDVVVTPKVDDKNFAINYKFYKAETGPELIQNCFKVQIYSAI